MKANLIFVESVPNAWTISTAAGPQLTFHINLEGFEEGWAEFLWRYGTLKGVEKVAYKNHLQATEDEVLAQRAACERAFLKLSAGEIKQMIESIPANVFGKLGRWNLLPPSFRANARYQWEVNPQSGGDQWEGFKPAMLSARYAWDRIKGSILGYEEENGRRVPFIGEGSPWATLKAKAQYSGKGWFSDKADASNPNTRTAEIWTVMESDSPLVIREFLNYEEPRMQYHNNCSLWEARGTPEALLEKWKSTQVNFRIL